MTNILWCESPGTGDCLATGEWDVMVEYIKHSSVTDFIIYGTEGTCADTGQAFKFSQAGILSQMYGGADTGDDMAIYANDIDTYPFVTLEGNEGINLDIANDDEIVFKEGGLQFFKFDHTSAISEIYGGAAAYDAMFIYANSSDPYPFITLAGGSDICLEVADTDEVMFKGDGNAFFTFDHTAGKSHLYGGGTTGEDLLLYANKIDNCSMIELSGNSGITCKVKATGIFEVSTCADETLFEIDSATGNHHMHFHCLDACDFVLENRTSDPGSPCTGQIWFRTDLVQEPEGTFIGSWSLTGANAQPQGITTNGTNIWVVDFSNLVYKYDMDGTYINSFVLTGGNNSNYGITTDGTNIWVIEYSNDRVYKYTMGGSYIGFWMLTGANNYAFGIATDGTNILVCDPVADSVFKYNMAGGYVGSWALTGANGTCRGITTDGTNVWVTDTDRTVYKYDMAGGYVGSWALTGDNVEPWGLATAGTNIWVVDQTTDKVYKYAK